MYGKTVWKHLSLVKQRLVQEEPIRQPWLKLVKDIVEYILTISRGKPAASSADKKWFVEGACVTARHRR